MPALYSSKNGRSSSLTKRLNTLTVRLFQSSLAFSLWLGLTSLPALAAPFTWDNGGAGGYWGDPLNWTADSGFPNAIGDTVSVNANGTVRLADATGLDASFTISSFSSTTGSANIYINNIAGGSGSLIFDVASGNASMNIVKNSGKDAEFRVPITLNDNLGIRNSGSGLRFYGKISSGTGLTTGLIIQGQTGTNTQGIGVMSILAAADYTGATTIEGNTSTAQTAGSGGGKLLIGGDNFLPATTVLAVNGSSSGGTSIPEGGRLDLNGKNQTVAGLTGTTGTALGRIGNNTVAATTSTLTIHSTANHIYNGLLSDAFTGGNLGKLALQKSGSGTQTLNGTNTYSGQTTITAGSLIIGGSGSINSTSGVTIHSGAVFRYNSSTAYSGGAITNNGGTITGSGSLNVAVTLDSLADVLAPGNSPGIQPFGTNQTWSSFTYEWETNNFIGTTAGADFDQIAISGALNLDGGLGAYELDILSLTGGNLPGLVPNFSEVGRQWIILTTTLGLSGFDAANWTLDTSGFTNSFSGQFSLSNDANNLYLNYTVVPEPSSLLLLGMALSALGLARRRRV